MLQALNNAVAATRCLPTDGSSYASPDGLLFPDCILGTDDKTCPNYCSPMHVGALMCNTKSNSNSTSFSSYSAVNTETNKVICDSSIRNIGNLFIPSSYSKPNTSESTAATANDTSNNPTHVPLPHGISQNHDCSFSIIRVQNNTRLFCCLLCQYSTNTKENLVDHLMVIHPKRKRMVCPICRFVSFITTKFKMHLRNHHDMNFNDAYMIMKKFRPRLEQPAPQLRFIENTCRVKYFCPRCNDVYIRRLWFKKHISAHINLGELQLDSLYHINSYARYVEGQESRIGKHHVGGTRPCPSNLLLSKPRLNDFQSKIPVKNETFDNDEDSIVSACSVTYKKYSPALELAGYIKNAFRVSDIDVTIDDDMPLIPTANDKYLELSGNLINIGKQHESQGSTNCENSRMLSQEHDTSFSRAKFRVFKTVDITQKSPSISDNTDAKDRIQISQVSRQDTEILHVWDGLICYPHPQSSTELVEFCKENKPFHETPIEDITVLDGIITNSDGLKEKNVTEMKAIEAMSIEKLNCVDATRRVNDDLLRALQNLETHSDHFLPKFGEGLYSQSSNSIDLDYNNRPSDEVHFHTQHVRHLPVEHQKKEEGDIVNYKKAKIHRYEYLRGDRVEQINIDEMSINKMHKTTEEHNNGNIILSDSRKNKYSKSAVVNTNNAYLSEQTEGDHRNIGCLETQTEGTQEKLNCLDTQIEGNQGNLSSCLDTQTEVNQGNLNCASDQPKGDVNICISEQLVKDANICVSKLQEGDHENDNILNNEQLVFSTNERNQGDAIVGARQNSGKKVAEKRVCKTKVVECPFCDYSTRNRYTLKGHIYLHTGIGMLYCPYCSYKTTRKDKLKEHISHHTGEGMYCCQHCSYSTTRRYRFREHMILHTGIGYRKCPHCSFQTIRNDSLRYHIMTLHYKLQMRKKKLRIPELGAKNLVIEDEIMP